MWISRGSSGLFAVRRGTRRAAPATFGGRRRNASGDRVDHARRTPYSWSAPWMTSRRQAANVVVGVALVPEERRRDLDVGHRRAPARTTPRASSPARRSRPTRRRGARAARAAPVAHACRERDRVADVRARTAEQVAGGLARAEVARAVGLPRLGAGRWTPGARLGSWRGRSSSSGATNGIGGHG